MRIIGKRVKEGAEFREADELISLVNVCKAFNALPRAGGLYDQDSFLVEGMIRCVAFGNIAEQREIEAIQKQNS